MKRQGVSSKGRRPTVESRRFLQRALGIACAGALLILLAGGLADAGQKLTIRFGSSFTEASHQHQVMKLFAERTKELTKGTVEVVIYPNGQMGNEREMVESVETGALELVQTGGSIQSITPEVGIFYLPYLYRDDAHFEKVWTLGHPIANEMARRIEAKGTVKVLGYAIYGLRDTITKSKAVRTLEDFKGLKIRVDDAPTSAPIVRALGGAPVPIAFNEVYQALQTGVVDGAENPANNMVNMKWYEVAKHVSLTAHLNTLAVSALNMGFWKKLTAEQQAAVMTAASEAYKLQAQSARTFRQNSLNELKSKGMTITDIPDKTPFANAVKSVQTDFVAKYGLQKEYQAILDTK
jgi:tripartite ATP-independent transporter DctP family solute receptor